MPKGVVALALGLALLLSACQRPGPNVYTGKEVGKASFVSFGTVLAVREVTVQGENTWLGAGVGAAAGGIGGSAIGSGAGNAATTLAGVVVGGVAGALAEQAISGRTALEYTVTMESGLTMAVVQDRNEGDRVLQPGERVMLQTSGATQRVLPANQLPTQISRPMGVKVVD
jgi:outer membrane lipoprotein SlyB